MACLSKQERLCAKKTIGDVLKNGNTFYTPVLTLRYQQSVAVLDQSPHRVLFSASKKK